MSDSRADPELGREVGEQERGVRAGIPRDQLPEWIPNRLEEGRRQPHGQGRAERIPQAPGVLGHGIPLIAGDPHGDDPALCDESREGRIEDGREFGVGSGGEVVAAQRTEDPEQVGHFVGIAGGTFGGEPLQLGAGGGDGPDVEQLAQRQRFSSSEQLGE